MLIGLQLRYGTAAEWTAANPVLAIGEEGHETDTGKRKVGNGTTAWNSLAYWIGGGAVSAHAATHATGQADAVSPSAIGAEAAGAAATHSALTTGVHGVGSGTIAKIEDITKAAVGLSNVVDKTQKVLHGIYSGLSQTSPVWSDSTHTITLPAHVYYFDGVPVSVGAGNSVDFDTVGLSTGMWYVYYSDATGVLRASKSPWSILTHVMVCGVWWNGSNGAVLWEGHQADRSRIEHLHDHTYEGAKISASDFACTAPSVGSPSTIAVAGGTLNDDGLDTTHSPMTSCRLWRQTGASTYTWAASNSVYGAAVSYADSANAYALTPVDSAKYVNVWGYIAPDPAVGMYCVVETMASAGYQNVTLARAVQPPNLSQMGLSPEMRLAFRWIYRGSGAYQETTDYRASAVLAGAGGSSTPSAANVTVSPAGTIAATNVQAALEELDAEKAATETPAANANVTGAAVTPDFATTRTLSWTCTGNVTSFALATNLPAQACSVIIIPAGFTLPANPPSTAYKGAWNVTGTRVRIVIEVAASGAQLWTADSLTVVA